MRPASAKARTSPNRGDLDSSIENLCRIGRCLSVNNAIRPSDRPASAHQHQRRHSINQCNAQADGKFGTELLRSSSLCSVSGSEDSVQPAIPVQAGVQYETLMLSPLGPDRPASAQDHDALGWASALEMLCMGAQRIAAKSTSQQQLTTDQAPGNAASRRPATAHPMSRAASHSNVSCSRKPERHARPLTAHGSLSQTRPGHCSDTPATTSKPNIPDLALSFVSTVTQLLHRVASPSGMHSKKDPTCDISMAVSVLPRCPFSCAAHSSRSVRVQQ